MLAGLRQGLDLREHFLDPAADVLAFFPQLNGLTPQPDQFLFAIFELLPQPLGVALSIGLSLAGSLEHLYSAINFLFQCLEIVGGNLLRYLFHCIQSHNSTFPEEE
jgi:hypothetical protein